MFRLCVDDRVILTEDYLQYGNASSGPLKPGDVGTIEHDDAFTNNFRVTFNDVSWFYPERALRLAPASDQIGFTSVLLQASSDLPPIPSHLIPSAMPSSGVEMIEMRRTSSLEAPHIDTIGSSTFLDDSRIGQTTALAQKLDCLGMTNNVVSFLFVFGMSPH